MECNLDNFTISTLNSSYQFDTYIWLRAYSVIHEMLF